MRLCISNKRPMGHIAHLINLGPHRNMICISFPFAPFDARGPMILINLPLFYVRIRFLKDPTPFLHFCDYLPFEEDLALYLNKHEFPSSKDNFVLSLIELVQLVLEKI
jgi:hypothetical protein